MRGFEEFQVPVIQDRFCLCEAQSGDTHPTGPVTEEALTFPLDFLLFA